MDQNSIDGNRESSGTRGGIVIGIGIFLLLAAVGWYFLRDAQSKRDGMDLAKSDSIFSSTDSGHAAASRSAENLPADYKTVPQDAILTERSGRKLKLGDLNGTIWVANFIFTRCAGPCPMLSSKMASLQTSFRKAKDVKLVSFSVDPEHDTPKRLAEYANEYQADPERWLFLTTGDKPKMWDLAMKGFALGVGEDTLSSGQRMIYHEERFVVVDANGSIRGYFESKDKEWQQKLLTLVGALMREQGKSDAI